MVGRINGTCTGVRGVGVDIVKVERFKNVTESFYEKIFTTREREYLHNKPAESMAGLFAAKEAVAKAVGTGFSGFFPRDIEILHKQSGKPYVVLHGNAKKATKKIAAKGRRFCIHISISHTKTDAIAYACVERC